MNLMEIEECEINKMISCIADFLKTETMNFFHSSLFTTDVKSELDCLVR